MDKVKRHKRICKELNEIYDDKNKDYGDSFTKSFEKYGLTSSAIRLGDKFYRLESLLKNGEVKVKDESVKDTLMDMANYCIMTLIEMEERDALTKEELEHYKAANVVPYELSHLEEGELTFDE